MDQNDLNKELAALQKEAIEAVKKEEAAKVASANTPLLEVTKKLLSYTNDVVSYNNVLKQRQQQLEKTQTKYYSTTNYWNNSLAKDLYNMNGNALNINSFLAMRQMLGIVNGNAAETGNKTLQQPMDGINNVQPPSSPEADLNGSGVGLVKDKQTQGWWLWIFILNRIDYFTSLVKWDVDDWRLRQALNQYMFNAVTAGQACIIKKEQNYLSKALSTIEYDEFGNPEKGEAYAAQLILQRGGKMDDDDLTTLNLTDENVVYGFWKSNHYSIWFYVLSYLPQGVDFLYLFWNKTRLTKTVILQKKADAASADNEANAFLDPYQNVVPVITTGFSMSQNSNTVATLENRYELLELGNPEVNEGLLGNFFSWMDYWDNLIGIRTAGNKTSSSRSIADEVKPHSLRDGKIQQTYLIELDNFCDRIKEQWGIEVKYTFDDEEFMQSLKENNPEMENEGGDEAQQKENNGEK